MPRFIFKCEHHDYRTDEFDSRIVYECQKEYIYDVIEEFERFLRGSGFVFEGHLEFVDDHSDKLDKLDDNIEFDGDNMNTSFPFPIDQNPTTVAGSRDEDILHVRV